MVKVKMRRVLVLWSEISLFSVTAMLPVCQAADGGNAKKPDLHQLFRHSNLPRTHADFSMFRYVPKGDVVVEEPEKARLLFRTPHGEPDGYAERRGSTVFYYDRNGQAQRVQRLTPEEVDRLNHPY